MVQEGKDHVHEKWDFPGGGLEHEESVKECAEREVKEETGFEVEATGFYGVYTEESHTIDLPVLIFMIEAEIKSNGEPDNHFDGEILDHQFFTPDEIRDLDLRKDNRARMLEHAMERNVLPIERIEDIRKNTDFKLQQSNT